MTAQLIRGAGTVTWLHPAMPHLLAWAAGDPEARMRPEAQQAYLAGYDQRDGELAPHIVRTGGLVIALDARQVTVNGVEQTLSSREWGVLSYLAARLGRWCSTADILVAVWGESYINYAPYRSSHGRRDLHTVRVVMARLRIRLGEAAGLLVTQPTPGAAGYRLEARPPT